MAIGNLLEKISSLEQENVKLREFVDYIEACSHNQRCCDFECAWDRDKCHCEYYKHRVKALEVLGEFEELKKITGEPYKPKQELGE